MENNYIKLNKVREFGDVFNDTFALIRQEAKPLGSALLLFALPLLLISSIGTAFVQSNQLQHVYSPNFDYVSYFTKFGFMMIFIVLAQNMLMVTVYSYFKLYFVKGPGNFTNQDIWNEIVPFFLPCLGTAFVLGIVIFLGLMLCILPGIYLAISLSLVLPIMIMENKGFGSSFSRSFELTHKQWWWTFLIIFVYIILAYVFMIILSIPGIIFGISTMFKLKDLSNAEAISYPTYLIIYNAVISLISTFFYAVLHVAIILQYFNIVELYEGKSLSQKLDQITSNDQVQG